MELQQQTEQAKHPAYHLLVPEEQSARLFSMIRLMVGDHEVARALHKRALDNAAILIGTTLLFRGICGWRRGSFQKVTLQEGRELIDKAFLVTIAGALPGVAKLDLRTGIAVLRKIEGKSTEDIERALLRLPSGERLIYVLRYSAGYPCEQIARLLQTIDLGASAEEVKAAAHASLVRLREILSEGE